MSTFIAAFVEFLNPLTILLTLVGCLVGMVLGAIPGLAGGTAITVLLPLTYAMNTNMAMAMLMGIYIGGDQFIHASSSSGNSRCVTVSSLTESYYANHYYTARRH